MSDIADKPFPSYLEMTSRLPIWFWWTFRLATIGVMFSSSGRSGPNRNLDLRFSGNC